MSYLDTVCAICTPKQKSSLGIIRLAGKDAFSILSNIIKKDVNSLEKRMVYYGSLYMDKNDPSTLIDKATYVLFDGESSFCGEDTVEFYLHGSLVILDQMINALVKYGAVPARGGEFTAKAYLHNKLDLIEAQAIDALIKSSSDRQKKQALNSLTGNSSKKLENLKQKLDTLIASIEVNIDYPDDDELNDAFNTSLSLLPELVDEAKKLSLQSKRSSLIAKGVKIAIVGEPNVGKSTLLNRILSQEKAIVTSIPGTTRDVVEGSIELNGILFTFYDTAGIRETKDTIEQIGIEKSLQAASEADLILSLRLKGEENIQLENINDTPVIYISTKKDLSGDDKSADISISNQDSSLEALYKLIMEKLDLVDQSDNLLSNRDVVLLEEFSSLLSSAHEDLTNGMSIDVVEYKFLKASDIINHMLGVKDGLEDVYDTIFSKFCVGK